MKNSNPATTPKLNGENLSKSSEWMNMKITNAEFQQCWREAIRKAKADAAKHKDKTRDAGS